MVSIRVMFLSILASFMIIMNLSSFETKYLPSNPNGIATAISENISAVNQTRIDMMMNPNFTFFNETSDLPSDWVDPEKNCKSIFSCTIKFTDGWNDYVSFSLSTTNTTNQTWSSIKGHVIIVKPGDNYQVISHMKLNKWTTQSHVALEGFNESSRRWHQVTQCPPGTNGPLDWREFTCVMTIPENIAKIRPVLNAGWSSQINKEATTWFDAVNLLTNVPSLSGASK